MLLKITTVETSTKEIELPYYFTKYGATAKVEANEDGVRIIEVSSKAPYRSLVVRKMLDIDNERIATGTPIDAAQFTAELQATVQSLSEFLNATT